MKKQLLRWIVILLVLAWMATPAAAEERYGKWIFELSLGGYNSVDEVRSNANNRAVYTDPIGNVIITTDPRPDLGTKNAMAIDSTFRMDLRVGYGLLEWGWGEFILDAGLGYMDGGIAGLEIAYQLDDEPPEDPGTLTPPPWHIDFLRVGDLDQIPVSIDGLVRFRPTKRLNPYVGVGVGYRWVEFTEDPEFTRVAEWLDRSVGAKQYPLGEGRLGSTFNDDIKRPRVEAPDSFFYEARLGVEWQLKPRWSIYLDTRYEWVDDPVEVMVNGEYTLGRATPNSDIDLEYPANGTPFRVNIPAIGGGPGKYRQFPDSGANWFVEGGTLDYGGFSFGVGARYSF
jgi:hypothetical protein